MIAIFVYKIFYNTKKTVALKKIRCYTAYINDIDNHYQLHTKNYFGGLYGERYKQYVFHQIFK